VKQLRAAEDTYLENAQLKSDVVRGSILLRRLEVAREEWSRQLDEVLPTYYHTLFRLQLCAVAAHTAKNSDAVRRDARGERVAVPKA
jgi:hypothetical protein